MADIAELGYKVDSSQLDRGERALDSQVKAAARAEKATARLEASWTRMGKRIGLSIAGFISIDQTIGRYIRNTLEAERVQAQLEQRIKSTGGAAGLSAIELNKMADSLQAATTFDDESITEAQALLLTFTKIGREEFPRATEAVLDMATALDTDLKSAALQVGKALNDPVLGVTALSRAGVQFSADQKAVIKDLVETGRQAEAQAVILRELETQMGGSARAARDTLGGALQALQNSFDNLLEGDAGGLTGVRDGIEDLNDTLNDPGIKDGVDDLVAGLLKIAKFALQATKTITQSWQAIGALAGSIVQQASASHEVFANLSSFGMADGSIAEGLARSARDRKQLKETLDEIAKGEASRPSFGNVEGGMSSTESGMKTLDTVVVREPKGKKSGGGSGASDAEREARRIEKALRDMTAAQREWTSELDETSNPILNDYNQRLDEIRESAEEYKDLKVPQEKVAEFTAEMERLALAIKDKELAQFQEEFTQDTLEMAAALQGPGASAIVAYDAAMKELNKELASGMIQQDQFAERARVYAMERDASAEKVLSDINLEIEALGKSDEWIAGRNALIAAGVTAESDWGQKILASTAALYEQGKAMDQQIAVMDEVRSAGSDLFVDIFNGRDAIESLEDAWDRVHQKILGMIADNLMEQLFGQKGTGGGGSGGDWLGNLFGSFFGGGTGASSGGGTTGNSGGGIDWGSLIGSFFGGGMANGGRTYPGEFYEVGERNRPELLNMRGRQFLIPGNRGEVVPMHGDGGGGNTYQYSITVPVQGGVDRRTRGQVASDVQREIVQSGRNR